MKYTLKHIQFCEDYIKNGKDGRQYSYTINKNSIIDWAYLTEAPKADPKVIHEGEKTTYVPDNPPIIEISSNPEYPAVKNVDDKEIAMYKDRLRVTVDELYEMLFPK